MSAHRSAAHRVTSVAVARRAGVSQSTVSLVLSGKGRGRVSAATQEAVRRAAARARLPPQRRGAGAAPGQLARGRAAGPRRDQPVLRPASCAAPSARRRTAGYRSRWSTSATTAAGRSSPSRRCAPGPVDGYLLFEVMPPEAPAPSAVVLIESRGAAAPVGALRLRGRRRGRHRAPDRPRPPADRPPRRRLRRGDLPPARGRPPARARRGRADPDALTRAPTAITIDDAATRPARCSTSARPR